MRTSNKLLLAAAASILTACSGHIGTVVAEDAQPAIFPDYRDVTVPCNIAPLNFSYTGEGDRAVAEIRFDGRTARLRERGGVFRFPGRTWRRICAADSVELHIHARQDDGWHSYRPFRIAISRDAIDPYISYRLIPPGYQGWNEMGLYQRNLENYRQTPILENRLTGGNCLNCHTLRERDPQTFLFHSRASFGGTFMLSGGDAYVIDTRTDSTAATRYACWHPSGRYIAFSVNDTMQNFFSGNPDRIEVYDKSSDVVIYDVEKGEMFWSPQTRAEGAFETYPTFSPDGRSLFFCSAKAVDRLPDRFREVKYSLCRVDFDPATRSIGTVVDTLFSAGATGLSVAFPRVSPDGNRVVFVVQDHGSFAIWHKDSDLWAVNLPGGEPYPLDAVNSPDGESWHSWSGNGRWLAFGSRRDDGLFTKIYISHFDEDGVPSKPFLLPQRDPLHCYTNSLASFNLPEFMSGPVPLAQKEIARTLKSGQIRATSQCTPSR